MAQLVRQVRARLEQEASGVEQTQAFDEQQVACLLAGTEADLTAALALVDYHLRRPLCGWLIRHLPNLDAADLADIWVETLAAILRAARAGRYDPTRSLWPWLRKVAYARAVDRVRLASTCRAALEALYHNLQGGRVEHPWHRLSGPERQELMRLIRQATKTLPDKEQVVFRTFVEGYPETADLEVLRREVALATCKVDRVDAIGMALYRARDKVRAILRLKGYSPEDE
jgi:DNA-directed RNA polymerase specialized sigma24 family protein